MKLKLSVTVFYDGRVVGGGYIWFEHNKPPQFDIVLEPDVVLPDGVTATMKIDSVSGFGFLED